MPPKRKSAVVSSKGNDGTAKVRREELFAWLCDFVDINKDVLGVQEYHAKSMFGGYALWADGAPPKGVLWTGVTYGNEPLVMFRTDEALREEMQSKGSERLMNNMPYFKVPQHLTSDRALMVRWGMLSAQAARKGKSGKGKRPADSTDAPAFKERKLPDSRRKRAKKG